MLAGIANVMKALDAQCRHCRHQQQQHPEPDTQSGTDPESIKNQVVSGMIVIGLCWAWEWMVIVLAPRPASAGVRIVSPLPARAPGRMASLRLPGATATCSFTTANARP
ncbi:MAG: hypothetical protein ACTHKB_11080 [Burkholderiaceae bacterium]